jgi:hypothetical protein
MYRLAATIILSSVAFAQTTQEAEIALAAKSPLTLARYVELHSTVDWKALRSALNLKEEQNWFAPCGGNAPANEARCSAETVTAANPDQTIVIIRGGDFSFTDEYLRYLRGPNRDWKFAGENSAYKRNGPSNHALVRLGTKPFLKISSNHSQNGAGIQQEGEDWFDLTLADFEPVFSFTPDGSAGGFEFTIPRAMKAQSNFSQAAGLERIDTTLNVRFEGTPGLDLQGIYVGVFERHANEKKFTLRAAYSGLDRHTTIPTKDFEDLANPFTNPAKETFMVYALPGLKKIAAGSNADDRGWLRDFLDHAKDTPEKRMLLELLAKP